MSRKIYDISSKLIKAKSVVKFAEGVEFKVNDSLPIALKLQSIVKDESSDEMERVQKIVGVTVGQEAIDWLIENDVSIAGWVAISEAIMAAINDDDVEEFLKRLNKSKVEKAEEAQAKKKLEIVDGSI